LVHYGFVFPYDIDTPSPDDDIRLDHIIIPGLSEEVRSRLQDVGFLGGYAYLSATHELCFKTQVAIRATVLTANEWEYYIENGEDLAEDQTSRVEKIVQVMFLPHNEQAQRTVVALRGMQPSPMTALLTERWKQIITAYHALYFKVHDAEVEEKRKLAAAGYM